MRYVLLLLVAFLAVGCAKFEVNPGFAEKDMKMALDQHESYCDSFARGRSPAMPRLLPMPAPYYSSATSGTLSGYNQGQYQSYMYSGSTYSDNSAQYNMNAMLNLAALIAHGQRIENIKNECMRKIGWKKKQELTDTEKERIAYNNLVSVNRGDPLYEDIIRAMGFYYEYLPTDQKAEYRRKVRDDSHYLNSLYMQAHEAAEKEPEKFRMLIQKCQYLKFITSCMVMYGIVSTNYDNYREKYKVKDLDGDLQSIKDFLSGRLPRHTFSYYQSDFTNYLSKIGRSQADEHFKVAFPVCVTQVEMIKKNAGQRGPARQ